VEGSSGSPPIRAACATGRGRTLDTAAVLPRVTGFPGLGVLRRLRPTRALRLASHLSTRSRLAGTGGVERDADGSHVHCIPVDEVGTRLCPCGIVTATPQTFTVTSRPQPVTPGRKFPPPRTAAVRTAHQPTSTGLELVRTQEALQRRFLTYAFSSRSPGPIHPAVLNRPDFVAAAPTLPADPRIRLPPASPDRCDGQATKASHLHPELQRLVAHHRRSDSPSRAGLSR